MAKANLRFELSYNAKDDRWRLVAESGHYREVRKIEDLPDQLGRMLVDVATQTAGMAMSVRLNATQAEEEDELMNPTT